MIVWFILNSAARIGVMLIVIYELVIHREKLHSAERFGLGLAGGAGLLTVPSIWLQPNPFENWASALFSIGLFVYLWGRAYRLWRHARNNAAMARDGVRP